MSAHPQRRPVVTDLSEVDVYRAIAHDPDEAGGIYLDALTATPHGLTVSLCDELDRRATYTLAITPQPLQNVGSTREQLLAERYGTLADLRQETP